MNRLSKKIFLGIKAAAQLGVRYIWLYAVYKLQLRSGILRWRTPAARPSAVPAPGFTLNLPAVPLPEQARLLDLLGDTAAAELIAEADEICNGKVRLFGREPQPLALKPPGHLYHWSKHTGYQHQGVDIKFVWEPGRFGWAVTLARAFLLTDDPKYAQAFWSFTETFLDSNPPNIGPHWASAQEVALRLIALVFAAGVFARSVQSTPQRMQRLAGALAAHAERIPPTLGYARAQNNNHLLSEAAALYTAAAALPDHPRAARWRRLGWRWFHYGLNAQIADNGAYAQHSTNYHRLMLQLGLWVNALAAGEGEPFPHNSMQKLASSTRWLLTLLDTESGCVPNLGSNDGAYILPLAVSPQQDFRPVLQAAGRAFLGEDRLQQGIWDEMSAWLAPLPGVPVEEQPAAPLRIEGNHSWGYLRAERFTSRPNHADQLHLDLWWRGHNLALDGGTYLYNADPPWRNPLDLSSLHNTVTVDGREQMTKSGQFLWLDWAQAEVIETQLDPDGKLTGAAARHNGYQELGVVHQRSVSSRGDIWHIEDLIFPVKKTLTGNQTHHVRLHWLLPDWEWSLNGTTLRLKIGSDHITIEVACPTSPLTAGLVRAGENLVGVEPPPPTRGWVSPTYGVKRPALSFSVSTTAALPVALTTTWQLPEAQR